MCSKFRSAEFKISIRGFRISIRGVQNFDQGCSEFRLGVLKLRSGLLKISIMHTVLTVFVGPCHHGMARPQVADGGTASDMEGSCE